MICLVIYHTNEILIFKYIFGIIGGVIFVYELSKRNTDRGVIFLYILLLLLVIPLLIKSMLFSTYEGVGNLPFYIAHIGFAISIYKKRLSVLVPKILFGLVALYICYGLFSEIDPNEIFVSKSRNHISILLIFLAVFIYLIILEKSQKVPLWPSLITLIISTLSLGRAGILASIILLLGLLVVKFKVKNIKVMFFTIAISLVSAVVFYINLEAIIHFISINFRFSELNYSDDIRQKIAMSYLENLDNFKDFIIGYPYDMQTTFYDGYTLHNSYLNAHFRFGAIALLIFTFIIHAILKGIRKHHAYLILLITILIRGVTDTIIIGENFDFIFFSLLSIILFKDNAGKNILSWNSQPRELDRLIHNIV